MSLQVMECTGEIGAISLHPQWRHPNIRFPGQYFDEETALHYNRMRYYDPAIGRYVSVDPIGQLGGFNLFAYTDNQPLRYSDPWGLFSFGEFYECAKGASAAAENFSVPNSRVPADATKHCLASCNMGRGCQWGTWGSALVGVAKEALDAVGAGNAEFRDLMNNAAGNICAKGGTNPCCDQTGNCCSNDDPDCEECCACLAESGELF